MACDKETILAHIERQLASGSPCESDLSELLELFWELVYSEACYNDTLRGLLTKREAVFYLMGCEAYSVDVKESHYQMNARTVQDTVADSISQSQSTGSTSKFAKGQGNTRYDETSTAQSDSHSTREMRGSETGDGTSFYRDDGKGYGFNNSDSYNLINNKNTRTTEDKSESHQRSNSFDRECNYEYSTNNTQGNGVNFAVVGVSFTGTGSEWRKYNRSTGASADTQSYLGTHYGIAREDGLSQGWGTHDWYSFFQSDIAWDERDYEIRTSRDRSDHRRTAEAHAQGSGDGISEQRAEARATSQGTAKSEGTSSTDREATRTSHKSAFELANSQRFRNLRLIYDQISKQIEHLKRRIRQTAKPAMGVMSCCCVSECRCLPAISCDALYLINLGRSYVSDYSSNTSCLTCSN